ncbi:MAG: serine/threonine protein phosphatase [Bacteroidales bacterium]|nr:serine/threonine protein phosphatase [Bacteroidales bacterium]
MKRWVIPDLHGCVKTLRALVENQIRPQGTDEIYLLGDYIDRGPDPKGVLDFIMGLQEKGLNIYPLRGNHEEYILLALENQQNLKRKFFFFKERNKLFEEWMRSGGYATLKSFGIERVDQIPEKYVEWIRGLKYFYELDQYVLVHAGINFYRKDPFDDLHALLWTSSFTPEPEKIGNRTVIHGHVPVSLEFLKTILSDPNKRYIPLDTGCYHPNKPGMGNLVALELNSLNLLIQPNIEIS